MAQVGRVRRDGHSCKTGNQLADQLQAPAGQLRRRETMPVTFPPSLLRLVAKPLATGWLHIATMGTDSWFAVTRHSTAEWLAQQTVEAFPWDTDRARFLPTKVLARADRMPFPELGGGDATARVHQGTQCNGTRVASWSGRPNSTRPVTCGDCVAHCTGSAARTHEITVGCAQYVQQCSKRL
jgi:hypothetical protein